eukprot:GHVR01137654.1.p1 GENE.GHVR01137654.1~~GHVR01137654.1.p1  ORF type:complete len:136 (+),score=6.43 GHVR01137654.1:45-452(+)
MMLKFLLLLPALVYATRYCIYNESTDCTGVPFCYGCSAASHNQKTGEELSRGWELKDGDVYEETYIGLNCSGSPIVSASLLTGKNIQLDKCYNGENYYGITDGNSTDISVKFGNANSVGISMILLGLLLSLPFLK